MPDGHYQRARNQGISAVARAVKCYPFGGESSIQDGELIGINIPDADGDSRVLVSMKDKIFRVKSNDWKKPHLTLELSKDLFKKAILGRYRWLFLMGKDEVKITYSDDLPHSDWITLLEILAVMQELAEFDADIWNSIENM